MSDMSDVVMLSNKPYLIRAFYEWIVDSRCTPFINVNSFFPHCKVPQQFIDESGQITLNVSPDAIRDFKISNDSIEFRASFSAVVYFISVPIEAVLAVYAQENGQGMFFDFEDESSGEGMIGLGEGAGWEGSQAAISSESSATTSVQDKKRSSHLKLVE